MPQRLSSTLREIHRLGREAPAATFQDDVFEAMKNLIRFDTGFWGGGRATNDEPAVLHYVHLHRLPDEMTAAFEKVKFHPKQIEFITRCATNAGKAQIFDTREAGMSDFYGFYGVDQIVTLYQPDADLGLYHVLSLYRSGDECFTEQERLLFESVVPHLLDTYRESRLLHLSDFNRESRPFAPATALIDWGGAVHFARPAFATLLRCESPEWYGPYLPGTMRRMQDGSFVGEEVVVRFTPQSDSLYLAVMRKKGPLDRLTDRELEVTRLLARSMSHKEIAQKLAIAPATARNHVANIHIKLGTSKSTQIATLLLNEGWF